MSRPYMRSRRQACELSSRIFALLDSAACFDRMAKLSASPDHTSPHDRTIHDHCASRAADARRQTRMIAADAGLDYEDILRRYVDRRGIPYAVSNYIPVSKRTTPPLNRRKSKMRIGNIALVCVVALLMSVSAPAQNRVRFVSSSAKNGSPVPSVCIQQAQVAISIIRQFPHPDTWTWVVICDDLAWQQFERHIGWDEDGSPLLALTDRASKVTYLRGDAILHPALPAAARPEHFIAHELAHIALNSSDESAVDKLAWKWQRGMRQEVATR